MAILLNIAYACLLSFFVIRAVMPRWRRMDILGGFWPKIWGFVPSLPDDRPVIWFHAVSVGEALLCRPLVDWFHANRSEYQLVISVSTPDGLAVARRAFPDDTVFFAPYDFSWAVKRVYRALSPRLLLISENDFWPNMMCQAIRRGTPIAIFNTRIARREQIEHQYDAWALIPGLRGVKWWGVISSDDAAWIQQLFGVGSPPVQVTGSLKYDGIVRERTNPQTRALRKKLGFSSSDRILLAGSTHAPEEEELVKIVISLTTEWPNLRLVLVPRNRNRFDLVDKMVKSHGIPYIRFSEVPNEGSPARLITLVDTMGLLRDLWGLADFGFVGGSLAEHGGHNIVEPASYGVPVCCGPHTWNFSSVSDSFITTNAAKRVNSYDELKSQIVQWLKHPQEMIQMGERARELVAHNSDAVSSTIRSLEGLLNPLSATRSTTAATGELKSDRRNVIEAQSTKVVALDD